MVEYFRETRRIVQHLRDKERSECLVLFVKVIFTLRICQFEIMCSDSVYSELEISSNHELSAEIDFSHPYNGKKPDAIFPYLLELVREDIVTRE